MSVVVRINCDKTSAYSRCGSSSWPADTVEEALRLAAQQGWYIKPDRHLCPDCCGHRKT